MERWEAQELADELATRHGNHDHDDEPEDTDFCPKCKGDRVEELGRLGSLLWLRCKGCHAIFNEDEALVLYLGEELVEKGELK